MTDLQHKDIRTAGILYLILALSAPLGLIYVPSTLIIQNDAAATVNNIRTSEWLFRLGIASELFHQALVVYLVMVLYRLFKPVNETQARLLVALGALVSVPVMFANSLTEIAALTFVKGPEFLSAFSRSQLDGLALLSLRLHEWGITVASVFWGLWLFPFGILVIRSGFIPRVFGFLLFAAGAGYLASAAASVVFPEHAGTVGQVAMILEIGELPIIFWLFIRGLRPPAKSAAQG